jgi:hypothetical protein
LAPEVDPSIGELPSPIGTSNDLSRRRGYALGLT